ncbi:LuxR C-terminal-related transcriptional regulator [Kitasatospora sp. NPDC048545]|uniref:response regulator transcription factor n=1 Tax=Kitasatospora sp. NPDC048545 TaxID=3157208 RepID=UPI0033DA089D
MTFNARPGQALTRAEIDTLRLAADGCTINQTAHSLNITRAAVVNRTQSARTKLGARSTTHAVVLAHQTGQLDLDCGAAGITRALEAAARLAASTPRSAA